MLAQLPLSLDQEHRVFVDDRALLRTRSAAAFRIPIVVEIDDVVDPGPLKLAVNNLVARAPALRAMVRPSTAPPGQSRAELLNRVAITGIMHGGLYVQHISTPGDVPFESKEVKSAVDLAAGVQRAIEACYATPIDYTKPSRLYTTLLRSRQQSIVIMSVDGLSCDRLSTSLLIDSIKPGYRDPDDCADSVTSSSRYESAVIDHVHHDTEPLQDDIEYWHNHWLKHVYDQADERQLRFVIPSGIPPSYRVLEVKENASSSVSPADIEALRLVCDDNGVSLRAALMSAFALALRTATGRSRWAFWSTFAPSRDKFQGVVGSFSRRQMIAVDVGYTNRLEELRPCVQRKLIEVERHATCSVHSVWSSLNQSMLHGVRIGCDVEGVHSSALDEPSQESSVATTNVAADRWFDAHVQLVLRLGGSGGLLSLAYDRRMCADRAMVSLLALVRLHLVGTRGDDCQRGTSLSKWLSAV